MMRTLIAPIASRFSPNAASESGWMYEIVTGMIKCAPDLRVTCVSETGDRVVHERIDQHIIGRRRSEEVGGAVLPLRIAAEVWQVGGLGNVDLVHHGLPFAPGRTYSLLAAQAARYRLPFVVGPVQAPLAWNGASWDGGRLGGLRPTLARSVVNRVARGAWPVVSGGFGWLSDLTLRSARRVVAIDEQAANLVASRGVPPERIRVIPPPLDVAGNAALVRRSPDGVTRVVTAGYLIERKAVGEVIIAVAKLAAGGARIVLDVVGDGPQMHFLRRLARELPGGEAIRFHGWLEREALRCVLASADVYATMSRAESWGQAVVEAMATGLLAVSTANSGARSLAKLGAPLRLVGMGAVAELEAVLTEWCGWSPAVLRNAGLVGAHWASATVAVPVVANSWLVVYREAMEDGRTESSCDRGNRIRTLLARR